MTCVVNTSTRRIEMTGSFNSEVEAGGTIEFFLGNFINPISQTTDSFKVTMYTDSAFQYTIDKAESGMVPGIECVLPCKSCVSADAPSECTSCHEDGTTAFPYLMGTECVAQCPSG